MPTVLVVDDSQVDRLIAGRLLEKQGTWGVDYAPDGKAALRQLEMAVPDLVLTDLQMPEMNGLDLVTSLKTDFPLIPVILMTAQGSEDVAAEAMRRGAASYVPKRKLAEDLVDTVERVMLAAREDRSHLRLMHHLSGGELQFDLGNDLSLVRQLTSFLQPLLRCLPLADETERLRVAIAVEEALKNAYYHGNLEVGTAVEPSDKSIDEVAQERLSAPPYNNRRIQVRANISPTEAVFVIRDDGPGFDANRILDPALGESYRTGAGRGLDLMRTIMDEVRFNEKGNEVTLVKRPPAVDLEAVDDDEA